MSEEEKKKVKIAMIKKKLKATKQDISDQIAKMKKEEEEIEAEMKEEY